MTERRWRRASAALVLAAMTIVGCGDDDDDGSGTTTAPPTSSEATTTTSTTIVGPAEDAVATTVRTFAEDVVGMVDPVIGPVTLHDGAPAQATVEVRTRREGGAEDDSLPPTVVELTADGDGWRIVSATGPDLTIDSPPAGMRLSAGFVTPSGRATAYEGTVVVQALLGTEVLGEEVTTAEGIDDAPWSARVETGVEAQGDGWILAFTTAGTELGAPVFALVPVTFGEGT
jgi:hypothetical protein